MNVAFVGDVAPGLAPLWSALREAVGAAGHDVASPGASRLVLNATSPDEPRPHWVRERLEQFGVTLLCLPLDARPLPQDVLAAAYPALVRTLSNAVVAVSGEDVHLVTPELGVRRLDGGSSAAARVLEAVLPLAATTFAIANDVSEDLPAALHGGNARTRDLAEAGRRLAALGLLPHVVRLEDLVGPEERRMLRALYGLQQISYGNASVREPSTDANAPAFWMTGRGADKSKLGQVGRDMLLVTGHDAASGSLRVSVPPGCEGARVSVDAMEHALIYERLPQVGAIVHAHGWIDGVASTRQAWPCGTVELAREVLDIVLAQPDPACAEVGLRNHGLTLTGPSLPAIFERVGHRIIREVPAT